MTAVPAVLCALAILAAQAFYGGLLRPVFANPALVVVGGAGLLGTLALFRKHRPAPDPTALLSCCLLAAWLIWRCWDAPPTAETSGWLRLITGCAVVFFLFAGCITRARDRLIFFSVLLVAATIQSALGGYQFVQKLPGMPFDWLSEQLRIWYSRPLGHRAHGFFINGNHLAWFLNIALLAALSVACWARWPLWARLLSGYIAAVGMAGSVATLSRGGYIGLGSGLSMFLVVSALILVRGARYRRSVAVLALLGGLGLAAASAWLVFSQSHIVQQRLSALTSDAYRPMVLESVARQFQITPLKGGGPGAFKEAAREFRGAAAATDDMFAHNDWAQLPADFGFPAFALMVVLTLALFRNGLRSLTGTLARRMAESGNNSSNQVAVTLAALCGFAACVVHSFFDFNMQLPANALLAAACAGMLATRWTPGENSSPFAVLKLSRWAAPGLCAIGGAFLLWQVQRAAPRDGTLLRAENALLAGRFELAIEEAEAFLQRNPDDYDTRLLLGRTLLARSASREFPEQRVQDSRRAAVNLETARAVRPLDPFGEIALGVALGRSGDAQGAEQAAGRAIALFPLYYGGYEILAFSLEAQGQEGAAIRTYSLALTLPNAYGIRERRNALIKKLKEKNLP